MTVFNSGPINIESGNSAYFTVEFLDSSGNLTTPASASMTVSYTNASNASQIDAVTLSPNGSFFNGTWSSTSAALGLATWIAISVTSTETQATGQLRVIERQAT